MYFIFKLRVNIFFCSGDPCIACRTTVQAGLLLLWSPHSGSGTSHYSGHSKPCRLSQETRLFNSRLTQNRYYHINQNVSKTHRTFLYVLSLPKCMPSTPLWHIFNILSSSCFTTTRRFFRTPRSLSSSTMYRHCCSTLYRDALSLMFHFWFSVARYFCIRMTPKLLQQTCIATFFLVTKLEQPYNLVHHCDKCFRHLALSFWSGILLQIIQKFSFEITHLWTMNLSNVYENKYVA